MSGVIVVNNGPFEVSAYEFLRFAKSETYQRTTKSVVNALSNAKRAIECQIDTLLYVFGHYELAQKEKWSFPKKMEFLESIGIISPNILNQINRKRNNMEHRYEIPKNEEIVDVLDIAELFLEATDRFSSKCYNGFEIYYRDNPTDILIDFNDELCEFGISYHGGEPRERKEMKIGRNHPLFMKLLKKYVIGIRKTF